MKKERANQTNKKWFGWIDGKWIAIIALGLALVMTSSVLFWALLCKVEPTVVPIQEGEYWRTHSRTRVEEDNIRYLVDRLLNNEVAPRSNGLTQMQVERLWEQLSNAVLVLNNNMHLHVDSENVTDLVDYQMEIAAQDDEIAKIVEESFIDYSEERETVDSLSSIKGTLYNGSTSENGEYKEEQFGSEFLQRNAALYSLLIGVGLAAVVARVFTGALVATQAATIGMWAFPPITMPIAAGVIAGALIVMTVVILANWDKVAPIINSIKSFFLNAVSVLGWVVTRFFDGVISKAKNQSEASYGGARYITVALNADRVAEINQKGRNQYYIILGRKSDQVILGIVAGSTLGAGGIPRSYAVQIMRNGPNILAPAVGGMVVSVYTFVRENAMNITQEAGGVYSPVPHAASVNKGFRHWHNGRMINNYPNSHDSLPHAFFGEPVNRGTW
ncbi:MAG: hypothetical protein LBU60_05790 [Clostridiales bacterium]|jgi:hypothetical protein|nr:hypothetical protein [Clostridiales bacterium]